MTCNTLCPIPWNHLAIQQNGDLRQCCQMIHAPNGKFIDDDIAARFIADDIVHIRNHASIKAIRSEMLAGSKPAACQLCWDEEDAGISSKRQSMQEIYNVEEMINATSPDGTIDVDQIPLAYLDLRLGNLCNLKCRSCGASDSSLWVDDHAELTHENNVATLDFYNSRKYDIIKTNGVWKIDTDHFNWHDDPAFHTWLDTQIQSGLNRLYFTGGEPTINKQHLRILKRIIELGKETVISLEYNSNMVAIPPQLLSIWSKFSNVSIGASIDAIGDLATYIRHPGRWLDVEKNCDAIGYGQIPQIHGGVSSTISILNVRHFLDLTKWLLSKNYCNINNIPSWHVLHGPKHLNIQVLPVDVKAQIEQEYNEFYIWVSNNISETTGAQIREYYSGIIRFMYKDDLSSQLVELKIAMSKLDKLRNESLHAQIPWLANILNNQID